MTMNDKPAGKQSTSARATVLLSTATVAVAAVVGFGAVYVMARTPDNGQQPAKFQVAEAPAGGAALPSGPGTNALSTGQMAAFVFKKSPEVLADVRFLDASGRERTLKDWRGIPCRKEMPGLERLQKELGSDKFEVLAVSADRVGIEGAKKFLDGIKVTGLGLYSDPGVRITLAVKAIGLPATILIDREGREIGRLLGPAEWDSPEAKTLVQAALR